VGNSRIKWGRCAPGRVAATASLPPEDPAAWQRQADAWGLPRPATWVVTGVHPARGQALAGWLQARGDRVHLWTDVGALPLRIALERPDQVGIDRLLNGVAGLTKRMPGEPVVIVDAGSAVTVDWLDAAGAFQGGAIFPGFRLMAQALHSYTALLPLIEIKDPEPVLPGADTFKAMEAGIFWAVVGGVRLMIERLARLDRTPPRVFLTGGNGPALSSFLDRPNHVWSAMTLEGVRIAAEALP
jgi:type III pantothenate kinase